MTTKPTRTGMMIGTCGICKATSRMTEEQAQGGMNMIRCPKCSKGGIWFKYVVGSFNPDKVCDGRCMSAKRSSCDCSCGGENHGSAH